MPDIETSSCYADCGGLKLLGSRDPPALASQSTGITSMSHCTQPQEDTGFHYVGQTALELLTSSNLATSAFQNCGITDALVAFENIFCLSLNILTAMGKTMPQTGSWVKQHTKGVDFILMFQMAAGDPALIPIFHKPKRLSEVGVLHALWIV
ncbi:hypothetical protein AAY473_023548 [Plecturocebus cupreus]